MTHPWADREGSFEQRKEAGMTVENDNRITPSPYLAIIKECVADLIRITEAMGNLKTAEAELIVAKALAYATQPPMVFTDRDPEELINELQPGGIYWKKKP